MKVKPKSGYMKADFSGYIPSPKFSKSLYKPPVRHNHNSPASHSRPVSRPNIKKDFNYWRSRKRVLQKEMNRIKSRWKGSYALSSNYMPDFSKSDWYSFSTSDRWFKWKWSEARDYFSSEDEFKQYIKDYFTMQKYGIEIKDIDNRFDKMIDTKYRIVAELMKDYNRGSNGYIMDRRSNSGWVTDKDLGRGGFRRK